MMPSSVLSNLKHLHRLNPSITRSLSPSLSLHLSIHNRSYNNHPSDNVTAIYPKRIIIIRHGESKGNLNDKAYVNTPDWLIPLSKVGEAQSTALGKRIKKLLESDSNVMLPSPEDEDDPLLKKVKTRSIDVHTIGNASFPLSPASPPSSPSSSPSPPSPDLPIQRVYLYTSPYLRTKQTLARLTQELHHSQIIGITDSPYLTEQQFGNLQDIAEVRRSKQERMKYGRFYYRFPLGESGLDVYSRVSSFINTLFRDFKDRSIVPDENSSLILMTHGLTMRLLVMRFFQYSVRDFELSENAGNCSTIIMERNDSYDGGFSGIESKKHLYNLTQESLNLIAFPSPGRKLTLEDLIEEGTRSNLGSMAEPSDHVKYWTKIVKGKKF